MLLFTEIKRTKLLLCAARIYQNFYKKPAFGFAQIKIVSNTF